MAEAAMPDIPGL
jgi:hypothetical protein